MCLPVSLWRLRVWSFQRLSSGGIPAPSAFSRENHAGAAVSPAAKSLKWRSHSANPPAMQGTSGQVSLHEEAHPLNTQDIFTSHYERALGHKIMIICTLGGQICQYLSYTLIYKALSWVRVFCFEKKYWHEKLERAMDYERALGQNKGHIRS